VNAIAPPPRPPKRRPGTGTVGYHRATEKWRYRLPGGKVECGGYETEKEATEALDRHLAGHDPKLARMRKHLGIALDIAAVIGVSVDREVAALRTQRMIDDARMRRLKERAARMAAEEEGKR